MQKLELEVYSDATNAAIIRHPFRKFPGILVQGDTLYSMKKMAEIALADIDEEANPDAFYELSSIHEWLSGLVQHYKHTLTEHHLDLPFFEGKN